MGDFLRIYGKGFLYNIFLAATLAISHQGHAHNTFCGTLVSLFWASDEVTLESFPLNLLRYFYLRSILKRQKKISI